MREGLVQIDGSRGEGGGQILRTSLALSMITGKPMRMRRIRANRAKPGLRRQHAACVKAAARLCNAEVVGLEVSSSDLTFIPNGPGPRVLEVDIGSPGATTLVVQTVLVPAIAMGIPLRAVIRGGTHNPHAPPFEFLDRVFLPHLRAMGAAVTLTLERLCFAPGDGRGRLGELVLTVGAGALTPIAIVDTAPVRERRATAILSRLPTHVADRELGVVREQLGFTPTECEVRELAGDQTGNALLIEVDRGGARELVTSFGERGLRAEAVAQRACDELAAFLALDVPVGEHLADQLLLPMAVAGGGSFRTGPLSLHATTNIDTIRKFLDVPITVEEAGATRVVRVG